MKLDELEPGDRVKGFRDWGCVPALAVRTVRACEGGLFVKCTHGRHFLDGQVGDDGHLVGMERAP